MIMRFSMNGTVTSDEYNIKLSDVEDLEFVDRVKSYQTLRLERNEDLSIKSDTEYISTLIVNESIVKVRVNITAKIIEIDGSYYLPEIRYTVKGEFYETSEILYLISDLFSETLPEGVNFEVELAAIHQLTSTAEGGENNYE